ncbi:MAG: AraC family transcriptional regulator [Ramlibacter sp.]|nr:AraC family transcriptional regulator [Ramlibacter sp.]
MNTPERFAEFEAAERAIGCSQVMARTWEPNSVQDTHTHPFDARALVVQGEMWLTVGDRTQHLRPGDRFALKAGTQHAERYGPQGATYWVARTAQKAA